MKDRQSERLRERNFKCCAAFKTRKQLLSFFMKMNLKKSDFSWKISFSFTFFRHSEGET